jgi:ABC-type oligopeptide transport system substrate-binding subunit
VEYSHAERDLAIEELKAAGYEISKDNPVVIEIPYAGNSEVRTNRANVIKQSIEATFEGVVVVNLIDCVDTAGWLYAGYYPDYGYEMNADFMDVSGWGPDYGDPQTYLATMTPAPGGMVKSCGIY